MKTKLLLIGAALTAHAAAEEPFPVADYSWSEETIADGVEQIPPSGDQAEAWIGVTGTPGTKTTTRLLHIDNPAVTSAVYAIEGVLRSQDVEGAGYLEMWNEFSDGSRYFSRTMGEEGSMAKISGTTAGRAFQLPFNRQGIDLPPIRLEINLVLPGGGEVNIGPLHLVELDQSSALSQRRHIPFVSLLAIVGVMVLLILITAMTVRRSAAAHGESVEERKMKASDT